MTEDIDIAAGPAPQAEGPSRPHLAAWHLVWSLAVLVGGLMVNAAAGGLPLPVGLALAAGLIPGAYVMVIGSATDERLRMALLPIWAACGAFAVAATGGMGGPMAAWCVAPLAVAGVLDRRGALGLGASLSVLAIIAVVFAQLTGSINAPPLGLTGFALGLTAVSALVLGVGAGFLVRRRQTRPEVVAAASPSEAERLLASQGRAAFVIEADDRVSVILGAGAETLESSKPFLDLAGAEDRARLAEAARAARTEGRQTVAFAPAGDLDRWLELELSPMGDDRLAGMLSDQTEARNRHEALETAKTDAENLAAGKSRFLASMSHELRTPLNAIMGFSDIMRNKMFGELPGRYVEYADLIHESGAHLLDLISDVLDMSKIEAQRFELNTELLDAREPVSAALRILRHQADEAGVRLRANLPTAPLDVEADRRAIKQIVINLVSNALKFTPAGGAVIVGLTGRGRDMELTVADTGVGIAPEDLERLGRPYEQAGDAAHKARGTGLGLSLVRAMAELHGGRMVIESRLGEGTAVVVSMPVVDNNADAQPSPPDNVVAFNPQR